MLFVELALIRWTGSNVVYLSYFSNFVLLGSFLGIGIGFLRSRSRVPMFPWAAPALAFLVVFILAVPVQVDRTGAQLIFFGGQPTGLPMWLTLPIIFLAVAAIMAMIADGVARTFVLFEPLEAYRLDIVGSIIGIATFSALSFLGTPPIVWAFVVGGCFVVLSLPHPRAVIVLSALALVAMLGHESLASHTSWSPYYKVLTLPATDGSHLVWVNGIPHQQIESTSQRRAAEPLYFTPYERARSGSPGRVLIIGAGTGGDVAIALANGAKRVDAVEIDPRLYELGRSLNPDHPYDDLRVHVHITDGRAFLERSDDRFDMILFALPDSLLGNPHGLDADTLQVVRRFPEFGHDVLRGVQSLSDCAPIVLAQLEHYDGTGTPLGLRGERIPLGARVLSVANVYDVMTHPRAHARQQTSLEALQEIEACAGTQFDPAVVEQLLEHFGVAPALDDWADSAWR